MKHQLYFPARHAEQLAWLKHLRHQLTQVAEQLRLGELTGYTLVEALRDLDWLIYVMGPVMTQMRTQMKAITAVQKALLTGPAFGSGDPAQLPSMTLPEPPAGPPVKAGALKRIFKLVATIKVRTGYTTAVGKALGIVGNHYVKEADAPLVALLFNVDCRLATFSMARVPGGRFTDPAPTTLRFPETVAVVKEVAPVTLRVPDTVAFCKEVAPMIVGLFVEAAPIIAESKV
jgi:hypothetical protein